MLVLTGRDVPPCCPRHAFLFKAYQSQFGGRNQSDEQDEIDLTSFDDRGLPWKKLSNHKRLLHSWSFAFSPSCHSQRLAKHTYCLCHPLALSDELKPVLWQISCTTPHACLFLFCLSPPLFASASDTPASMLILRDVGTHKCRRKVRKMSSLMSNTKCELSSSSAPPLVWLLSAVATLAALLEATAWQLAFGDAATSHQDDSDPQKSGKSDEQKQWCGRVKRRESRRWQVLLWCFQWVETWFDRKLTSRSC